MFLNERPYKMAYNVTGIMGDHIRRATCNPSLGLDTRLGTIDRGLETLRRYELLWFSG